MLNTWEESVRYVKSDRGVYLASWNNGHHDDEAVIHAFDSYETIGFLLLKSDIGSFLLQHGPLREVLSRKAEFEETVVGAEVMVYQIMVSDLNEETVGIVNSYLNKPSLISDMISEFEAYMYSSNRRMMA